MRIGVVAAVSAVPLLFIHHSSVFLRAVSAAILTLAFGVCGAMAAESSTVHETLILHNAGFALDGDFQNSEKAFPNTSSIMKEKKGDISSLNAALIERLKAASFKNFTLTTELGNTKTGDSLSVAFVLTWENLSTERVDDKFKVVADLRGEALVVDFQSMKVIAAYPFGVENRDVISAPPTPEYALNTFRSLYLDQNPKVPNIFDSFANALKKAQIKRSYGAYAQVTDVNFEDLAADQIKQFKVEPGQVKDFIANAFETDLLQNDEIPLLPHKKAQAIGQNMSATFANGDVYNLALPEPDYQIHLTLRGFKKVQVSATDYEVAYAYASFAKISISQSLLERPYLDTEVKFAVSKTVPKAVTSMDDWSAYQESLLSLVDGATKQFAAVDDSWIKKWTSDSATKSQFELASKKLALCR